MQLLRYNGAIIASRWAIFLLHEQTYTLIKALVNFDILKRFSREIPFILVIVTRTL